MQTGSVEAFFSAVAAGDRDAVRGLLDRQPELIASRNAEGLSPLVVALYHKKSDLSQDLLARLGPEQLTIHEAAAVGNVPRLEQLLRENPQSVNAWSPDGFQPLGLAAFF